MSHDNDIGGLEDLAKGRYLLAFSRAIQKLSPVGGPTGTAGLMPAVPLIPLKRADQAGRHSHPALPEPLAQCRAIEVRTEGQ
jgi:hypothetical protein